MRTLTFLLTFALFPLLGTAQSVTISSANDSGVGMGCDTTGESLYHYVFGTSSGLNTGDTIDLYVDYDDGNGYVLDQKDTVDAQGDFWINWNKSYSSPGVKNLKFIAEGPNGNSDTASHTLIVSDSCSTIHGTVYLDKNSNCNLDGGESAISGRKVKATYNNNLVAYSTTGSGGEYQMTVGTGASYDVRLVDTNAYKLGCPSSGVQTVSSFPNYDVHFAMECPSSPDFMVHDGQGWGYRPDFIGEVNFELRGPSLCTNDSISCVKVVLPSELHAHDSLMGGTGTPDFDAIKGDTVVWNMDTIDLDDLQHGSLPVYTDDSAQIGDTLCVDVMICSAGDADPSNNSMQICTPVQNSWDPNNKRVTPEGEGAENYIDKNQRMTYTVNFQNTGNAPAVDVMIVDTLDASVIDPTTLRVMSSSHAIDQLKVKNNKVVEFHFNGIMLPDSGTSRPGSKGFVRFSIDQQSNLSDGTVIENNAAIYFDSNPAILTNETMNTIGEPSAVETLSDAQELRVFPNPASERIHIRSADNLKGQVVLRNMVGKRVLDQDLNGNKATVPVNELPSGVYLLSVQLDDRKEPVRKKVLID